MGLMLSKFFAYLALALLLLSGLWLLPENNARASAAPTPTPQPQEIDFTPRTGSLADFFERQPMQPLSAVSSSIRSVSDPARFLADLRGFHGLRAAELANPGWLHRLTRHMKLENGNTIRWQVEVWYFFDQSGSLSEAYERILDADGQVDQPLRRVALPENTSDILLPVSEEALLTSLAQEAATPINGLVFDWGFRIFAESALAAGWLFSSQILYENCWYMGETYNLSNGSLRISALFYPDTGKLRTLNVYDLSGTSLKLVASLELPIEELLAERPSIIP
jgi:hypothetical protein